MGHRGAGTIRHAIRVVGDRRDKRVRRVRSVGRSKSMTTIPLTGSQTVGPFFAPTLLREDARRNVLTRPETAGERIRIGGRVLDGDGVPVPDAMVEIWQANAHGRYNHPADSGPAPLDPSFLGFGRSGTEDDGRYWF